MLEGWLGHQAARGSDPRVNITRPAECLALLLTENEDEPAGRREGERKTDMDFFVTAPPVIIFTTHSEKCRCNECN